MAKCCPTCPTSMHWHIRVCVPIERNDSCLVDQSNCHHYYIRSIFAFFFLSYRSLTDDGRDVGKMLPIDPALRAVVGSQSRQSTIARR
jgi:hypothetical protein